MDDVVQRSSKGSEHERQHCLTQVAGGGGECAHILLTDVHGCRKVKK